MLLRKNAYHSLYLLVFILAGCTSLTSTVEQFATGIDGIACVGKVETPPQGLVEINDIALLQQTLGASSQGKLCTGKVFQAEEPVTVYRVWNSDKSYTVYGSWWSFEEPEGPKQEYREDNGICPSWSTLDRMTSCTIKVGSKIVVGPGQSAECKNFTYPKSDVNQVFIANDSRDNIILVDNCTEAINWP